MANKYFGTDGVRGRANVFPMTIDFAMKLAQVIAPRLASAEPRIAIARDTRISGSMLEAAMTAGFNAMGVEVLQLGVIPTPALARLAPVLNVDMAVMISASHNPYFENGIKLMNGQGHKLSDAEVGALEQAMAEETVYDRDKIAGTANREEAINRYLQDLDALMPSPAALKGLKLVLDCANGAFSAIAPAVFKKYGAEVIVLADRPDGYNINKDCGSTHPEKMMQTVAAEKAALGIAVDGDGDRIIVCDEQGHKLDGDQIIGFLAQYLQSEGKIKGNAVVSTIYSNRGLEKYLRSLGLDYYRTKVGERYVVEKMKEVGCNLGGEESGHMVAADYAATGDGVVVGLLVCLGLLKSGRKMSEIFPIFQPLPAVLSRLRFEHADKVQTAMQDAAFLAMIDEAKATLGDRGFIVLRKSGTEPMVQVLVQGDDEAEVRFLSEKLSAKAKSFDI